MSEMTLSEMTERYTESLKKAASRCRELGIAQKNPYWNQIAVSLEGLLFKGQSFFNGVALSDSEVAKIIDKRVKEMNLDKK